MLGDNLLEHVVVPRFNGELHQRAGIFPARVKRLKALDLVLGLLGLLQHFLGGGKIVPKALLGRKLLEPGHFALKLRKPQRRGEIVEFLLHALQF